MKHSKLLSVGFLAGFLLVSSLAGAAELTSMGMVGMTRGQIVRVSLFHEADVAGIVCPDIVEIVDADGKVLASTKTELKPGTGVFFDYDLAAGLVPGKRLQFHVRVRTLPDHPGAATVEIFDKLTGRTSVALPASLIPDSTLAP